MNVRRAIGAIAVASTLTWGVLPVLVVAQARAGIIAALSPDDYRDAMACGRVGADCAVDPYRLCPSAGDPFAATIATPFSRVASAIVDANRERRRPRVMERGAATAWGVGIYVYPAERAGVTATIQRVYLRRGANRIDPLTTTVAPVSVTHPDGSLHELARGFFTFPVAAFKPDEPVTVVFVHSDGESRCTLDTSRLGILR